MTLERVGVTMAIKRVPALICANCGEEYVDEEVMARIFKVADEAARAGVQVDIREYVAA